jgi:hypothetical protein
MYKTVLYALALLPLLAQAQLIDAEAYIKSNGHLKKTVAGKNTYFTTFKKVTAEEMLPYMESVKKMPRTEDARSMCKAVNAGAAKQLVSEGRSDLQVGASFGFGGPVDNTIACIVYFEQQTNIRGAQVHYLTLSPRSATQEIYTVILTH